MDLAVQRVLTALLPGPATPGILSTRYGMPTEEAQGALAHAIDEGLVTDAGPVAFQLTDEGRALARSCSSTDGLRDVENLAGELGRRNGALRRFDI